MRIRGRDYPVVLPTIRDPRLHLAAVIISIQVLGQTVLGFEISIAQILIALLTSALLDFAITFHRERALIWPASAMLTGNGVAFILRVPGTRHGDWWSVRGGWIFAATAAVSLLSKYLIRYRGIHVFNPSNFGLLACFLILGSGRADPLDFWWGPTSPRIVVALTIIVVGGLVILSRLRMLSIALTFWVTFGVAMTLLAAAGHCMTARWHLGPLCGDGFGRVLVTSPEILVFMFFMITDPKTSPAGKVARSAYSVAIAVVAALLIAPQRTEFATKVAVLAALLLVCAARPFVEARLPAAGSDVDSLRRWMRGRAAPSRPLRRPIVVALAAVLVGAILVVATAPNRGLDTASADGVGRRPRPVVDLRGVELPPVVVEDSEVVAAHVSRAMARQIRDDVVVDLLILADAQRRHDSSLAAAAADAVALGKFRNAIEKSAARHETTVREYRLQRVFVSVARRPGQGAPALLVTLRGTVTITTASSSSPDSHRTTLPAHETYEVKTIDGHWLLVTDLLPPGFTPP